MAIQDYKVQWLSRLLHAFPHLDLTFQNFSSTFDPYNPTYRETILFWIAVPVLWLLFTLLLFLIYFCYRCCQRDVEKKQPVPCLRWSMAILALLTCGAVGVGFYGNEEASKGCKQLSSAATEANLHINQIKQEVMNVQLNVNSSIEKGIDGLELVFDSHPRLNPNDRDQLDIHTGKALMHANAVLTSVLDVRNQIERVQLHSLSQYTEQYGFYRWIGTIVLLSWMVGLCLLLLLGIGCSSKCTLLMFCAFGIFTLVLCWMSAGLHLGASVALSDFCVNPNLFFEMLHTDQLDKDVVRYYMKCDPETPEPFKHPLHTAIDDIRKANQSLNDALAIAERKSIMEDNMQPYRGQVHKGLADSMTSLLQLFGRVDCSALNKEYVSSIEGVCYMALPGMVFLLLSSSVAGLLFTILVVLASRAWRHFGRNDCAEMEETAPKGYLEIDEDDPFLPRPDNSSPSYYRGESIEATDFTRGSRGKPREHMSLPRRSTPPPAYNSNEFYRQYSDMNHTPEDSPQTPFRESTA